MYTKSYMCTNYMLRYIILNHTLELIWKNSSYFILIINLNQYIQSVSFVRECWKMVAFLKNVLTSLSIKKIFLREYLFTDFLSFLSGENAFVLLHNLLVRGKHYAYKPIHWLFSFHWCSMISNFRCFATVLCDNKSLNYNSVVTMLAATIICFIKSIKRNTYMWSMNYKIR